MARVLDRGVSRLAMVLAVLWVLGGLQALRVSALWVSSRDQSRRGQRSHVIPGEQSQHCLQQKHD